MLKILHWRAHAKWLCASSRTGCRGAEVCLELISLLLLSEIVYFILYARAVDAHRKIQYIVGRAEPPCTRTRSLHDVFRFLRPYRHTELNSVQQWSECIDNAAGANTQLIPFQCRFQTHDANNEKRSKMEECYCRMSCRKKKFFFLFSVSRTEINAKIEIIKSNKKKLLNFSPSEDVGLHGESDRQLCVFAGRWMENGPNCAQSAVKNFDGKNRRGIIPIICVTQT